MLERIPDVLLQKADELEKYYEEHYPALAPLAKQCFLNTIETTVKKLDDGSYFVITGDIPAMWLRDSAAQVRPYIKYAKNDELLKEILEGVIAKQAAMVNIDPYANAFNQAATGEGHQDITQLNDHVWERKYEIDSLCAPLYLAYEYWKEIGNDKIFTDEFKTMIENIVTVFTTEQNHATSPYTFERPEEHLVLKTDTLPLKGHGRPVNPVGLTWSGFRPSDDCCTFGYLIPSNMMAVVALRYAEEICRDAYKDEALAAKCHALKEEINDALLVYGVIDHPKYGKMFAYETDGYGHYNLMDDANSPSLLAMPYLDYCDVNDELYQNTRRFVLSKDNPYYAEGTYAAGVGSPHTEPGFIWHIGITMQILTSNNRAEIEKCLEMLSKTHADTNFMHESFNPNDPADFSRPWFAWANTLFAQMLERLKTEGFFEN